MRDEPLLHVENLKKWFFTKNKLFKKPLAIKAVDDVNLDIYRGETLGIVGESGCGKSTLGRTILRLLEPTSGKIHFDKHDVTAMDPKELRQFRSNMQIIFQDPYASLDPRMTIGDIIAEPLDMQEHLHGKEREARVVQAMERSGLDHSFINRYPHEFSGGQRQRVGIARAIILEPEFIVCDEPVSALDVSVQAQVVNLLKELQNQLGMSYLFISHDLSIVKHISHRVAVMYLGHIVEQADKDMLFQNPLHPYTKALLSAIPLPVRHREHQKILLEGDLPSPADPPAGCPFHTRCYKVQEKCKHEVPDFVELEERHWCACHYPNRKKENHEN